jgi:4-hydroxybutyryl-CoA dehydratase/vinylacetyl-CoA-Delta-isomerase
MSKLTLMTPEEYIESIKNPKDVFILGEKVRDYWNHPIVKPSIASVMKTYELAQVSEYQELMTAISHLTSNRVNRFNHIHQSIDDLVKKVKMQILVGQNVACCFERCHGWDALNAIYSVTYEVDQKYKTNYHERFKKIVIDIQDQDLNVIGTMTDVKGDRSKRPTQQSDPDLFLHKVDESDDGIIVRGAKVHQTGILNAHWAMVMPTLTMRPGEEEYCVSFALDTKQAGLTYVYGRQSNDTRKLEGNMADVGNPKYGAHECFVIFDDVFVPKERIFMDGEVEFAREIVQRFAGYHRQSYGGCKTGVGDTLIGASTLIAKYNGVDKSTHIKDKLIEMIHLNETLFCCGIACSALGIKRDAGNYEMDMLLANVCKQNITRFPYQIARLAEDIAGGFLVTLPSIADFENEEIGSLLRKYLAGCEGVSVEDKYKVFRFIEALTRGIAAVNYQTESMHGAGSPQAQRIMIARQANLDEKIKKKKKILDID